MPASRPALRRRAQDGQPAAAEPALARSRPQLAEALAADGLGTLLQLELVCRADYSTSSVLKTCKCTR